METLAKVIKDMGLRKNDCHKELDRDDEFNGLAIGGGAISVQEAYFLAGLLQIVQPFIVFDLGTAEGGSAVVFAATLKDMGKGRVISIDKADNTPSPAEALKNKYDLPIDFVTKTDSLDFLRNIGPHAKNDRWNDYFIFSDTDIKIRPNEVAICQDKLPSGTFIAVHDTNPKHPWGPIDWEGVLIPRLYLPSPRGLTIMRTL